MLRNLNAFKRNGASSEAAALDYINLCFLIAQFTNTAQVALNCDFVFRLNMAQNIEQLFVFHVYFSPFRNWAPLEPNSFGQSLDLILSAVSGDVIIIVVIIEIVSRDAVFPDRPYSQKEEDHKSKHEYHAADQIHQHFGA